MRATRFHGNRDIRVDDVPEPTIERPADALVEVTLAAICGSDLHFYRAGESLGFAAGERVGHEFMGTVVAVGPEVRRVVAGDRVVASPSVADGMCEFCREGLFYACERGLGFFGFSPAFWHYGGEVQGGQSELVRVPFADTTLIPLPESLRGPEHELALLPTIDVMNTGWHGASTAAVAPGQVALVIGDGAVGLCAVHAASAMEAGQVICVGHHEDRLRVAEELGATTVILSRGRDEIADRVQQLTRGQGAPAVIASVSGAEPMALAHACVRAGGVISCIGMDQVVGEQPQIDWMDQFLRNITITGGLVPGRRYVPELVALVERGRIDPSPVFTHRLPLERAPDGYRLMDERAAGVIKVALAP
jgi:threonine dehydrogenase-like Zn-dependent dehydrogenase